MAMRHNGFVAFILTHGRPDRVLTYEKLRKHGYTGKIYIVCDDEDKTLPEYRKRFGDVLVFSKSEIAKTFDEGDNFGDRRAIIYARNACFELARRRRPRPRRGIRHAARLFQFRSNADPCNRTRRRLYRRRKGDEIQRRNTADAQGHELVHLLRRPTVSIHRPYQRRRQYLRPAGVAGGGVFLSILQIGLDQLETQSNSGGMTELYLDAGTYVKSFYTVMYCPSCVVVSAMGTAHRRLHHHIKWRYAVPKILHESVKKVTTNGITPKQ